MGSFGKFAGAVALLAVAGFQSPAAAVVIVPSGLSTFTDTGNETFNSLTVGSTFNGHTNGDATFTGTGTIQQVPNVGGQYAAPLGDETPYLVVRVGQTERITFANGATSLSFFLGSADSYNTFNFYDKDGNSVGSFTGNQLLSPGNGDQEGPATNSFVFFSGDFKYVEFGTGSQNALELDSLSWTPGQITGAVPEPSTWAMMILGFLGVGFLSYRRRSAGPSLRVV